MENTAFISKEHDGMASNTELVDQTVFQSLVESFQDEDEGAVDEIFALFFEHMPGRIDELRRALRDGDSNGLCAIAHSIRGSCSNFGAAAMATSCGQIESTLRKNPQAISEMAPLVARTVSLYQATEHLIRDLIK